MFSRVGRLGRIVDRAEFALISSRRPILWTTYTDGYRLNFSLFFCFGHKYSIFFPPLKQMYAKCHRCCLCCYFQVLLAHPRVMDLIDTPDRYDSKPLHKAATSGHVNCLRVSVASHLLQ